MLIIRKIEILCTPLLRHHNKALLLFIGIKLWIELFIQDQSIV